MIIKNDGFSLKVLFGTYLDFSTGCWVLLGLRAMVCSTPRLPLAILFTKWRDLHQQEILFGVRQFLQMFMSQIFGCYQLSTQPPTFIGDDLTKDSWFMTQSSYYFAMGWIASCWSNGDFDLWGFFSSEILAQPQDLKNVRVTYFSWKTDSFPQKMREFSSWNDVQMMRNCLRFSSIL